MRLAIINTGGTIASRPDAEGNIKPDARVNPLRPDLPGLEGLQIEQHQPFNLPGPHITLEHMQQLRLLIEDIATRTAKDQTDAPDGIVITHGTDTLEETAFFLHLTLRTETPVVLTGSMKHALEPSWDGPGNLWDAIQVATNAQSRGRGALVVFSGDIYDARTVTKVHTSRPDAFGGYPGPIGHVNAVHGRSVVHYFARPEPRTPLEPSHVQPHVEILTAYAGWHGEGLEAALKRSHGVVIAALGTGNLPPALTPLIAATHKPVVICTRTHAGPILPVYGYEGGGKLLLEAGAIPASHLNAFKARILLIVLLALDCSKDQIAQHFALGLQ
jgi:L-asparaginase